MGVGSLYTSFTNYSQQRVSFLDQTAPSGLVEGYLFHKEKQGEYLGGHDGVRSFQNPLVKYSLKMKRLDDSQITNYFIRGRNRASKALLTKVSPLNLTDGKWRRKC